MNHGILQQGFVEYHEAVVYARRVRSDVQGLTLSLGANLAIADISVLSFVGVVNYASELTYGLHIPLNRDSAQFSVKQ